MQSDTQTMIQLFNTVAEAVGDGVSHYRMEKCRQTIHTLVCEPRPSRRPRIKAAALVAALPAVFAIAFCVYLRWTKPIPFSISGDYRVGLVGDWITTDALPSQLNFEMGDTRFVVQPGSKVKCERADESSVDMVIDKGSMSADIDGNGSTRWSVSAGPYKVVVLGTKFETAWDDKNEVLDVKVDRGMVLVSGDGINEQGVHITGGKHLRAIKKAGYYSVKDTHVGFYDPTALSLVSDDMAWQTKGQAVKAVPAGNNDKIAESNSDDGMDASGSVAKTESREPTRRRGELHSNTLRGYTDQFIGNRFDEEMTSKPGHNSGTGTSKSRWLIYYRQKQYPAAIDAAKAYGVDELLTTLEVDELWKLIHAARTVGEDEMAEDALLVCRDRFPGTSKAKRAAFLLGRMKFDKNKDLLAAASWFTTYLSETPDGPLSEEALGRLIVINNRRGRSDDAKQAAKNYLARYPSGTFADNAQAILKKE